MLHASRRLPYHACSVLWWRQQAIGNNLDGGCSRIYHSKVKRFEALPSEANQTRQKWPCKDDDSTAAAVRSTARDTSTWQTDRWSHFELRRAHAHPLTAIGRWRILSVTGRKGPSATERLLFIFNQKIHLLSYYLANKQSLHVHSQSLKILTLIGEKYKNKNYLPLPL